MDVCKGLHNSLGAEMEPAGFAEHIKIYRREHKSKKNKILENSLYCNDYIT